MLKTNTEPLTYEFSVVSERPESPCVARRLNLQCDRQGLDWASCPCQSRKEPVYALPVDHDGRVYGRWRWHLSLLHAVADVDRFLADHHARGVWWLRVVSARYADRLDDPAVPATTLRLTQRVLRPRTPTGG